MSSRSFFNEVFTNLNRTVRNLLLTYLPYLYDKNVRLTLVINNNYKVRHAKEIKVLTLRAKKRNLSFSNPDQLRGTCD